MSGIVAWMRSNLNTQGFCLTDEEGRSVRKRAIAT
jgi:hypothetical protein